jgi:hypothetical protein
MRLLAGRRRSDQKGTNGAVVRTRGDQKCTTGGNAALNYELRRVAANRHSISTTAAVERRPSL